MIGQINGKISGVSDAIFPNTPSCVLFDFDGTMYSFADVFPHVWRQLYDGEQRAFGGHEFQDVYDRIGGIYVRMPSDLGADEEHEYVFSEIKRIWPGVSRSNEQLIAQYLDASLQFMKPRPGLDKLLESLDRREIPWGIVSNHDGRNRHKLAAMNLDSQPATFMLSVEVGIWKPDALIFEMALEEIGQVERSAAVMVGDNPEVDIAGGKSAGMLTVLMTDSPFAGTGDGGADFAVGGFAELHTHWFGE